MNQFCPALALAVLLAVAAPARGDAPPRPPDEGWRDSACGGEAFSYAEVVSRPRGDRDAGPVTVIPDTLCPETGRPSPAPSIQIHIEAGSRRPTAPGQP